MKKLMSLLLLIVGCEETGITSNGLTDGTTVTDTLYIFNYDTLSLFTRCSPRLVDLLLWNCTIGR